MSDQPKVAPTPDTDVEYLRAEVEYLRLRAAALARAHDEVQATATGLRDELAKANARIVAMRTSRRWRIGQAFAAARGNTRLLFRLPFTLFMLLSGRDRHGGDQT